MKIWIFVIKFLFIGALFIVSNYNLNLGNPEHFEMFKGFYFSWLDGVYQRGAQVTGYVVESGWLPPTNIPGK